MVPMKTSDDQFLLLQGKEENKSFENEQKCKCIEQVFCQTNDLRGYSKSINSKQDVTLDQIKYLCGDEQIKKVDIDKNKSPEEKNNYHSKEILLNDHHLDFKKIVKIVRKTLNEDLKSKGKAIISFDSEITIIETPNLNNESFDSFEFFENEFDTISHFEKSESISSKRNLLYESDCSLLNSRNIINYHNFYSENHELTCNEIKGQKVEKSQSKSIISDQITKICKRQERIIFPDYNYDHYLQDPIEPFKLDDLGKSEKIGKWGVDSEKTRDYSKITCHIQGKNEKRKIFFPNTVCSDDYDNLNRLHEIKSQGFSTLCRKMMRWTNCVTKTLKKINKFPHVVVHLPSFACCNEFRCRAEKTYQSLQNIQIGRLGWLENRASQVLYICPDDTNLDIFLIKKILTLARPDVNFDNLWIIKAEKNKKSPKEKCLSGCENLFYTPSTYRRVRYLTAGRQAFIVPGILTEMDVIVACELKMAILGPCLTFQNRLLNKNYVTNVLHEANIKQPPFSEVTNFKELCSNLAKIIFLHPFYKWFIKINFGNYGYQTALYRVQEDLMEKIQKLLLSEKELESTLAVLLHKDIELNTEIYEKSQHFFRDLEIYGGILQACPNEEYHVISVGLLNEHDTAKPLLIITADVIKLKNDFATNVGYIIPQSKIPQLDIEKLSHQVGEIILREQYIGFYGIDIIVFENKAKVKELWVVNVNPYYTDLLSFNDWKLFCSKQCACCPITNMENNYAVCSGKLYTSGLSKYCGQEIIAFCKTQYDHKEKSGCILCPIDYNNRTFFLYSQNSNRKIAIKKFIETLRTLTKLSLGMQSDKLDTNMQQLARELEKKELHNFAN